MSAEPDIPMVILACAHPSKFPQAVNQAVGIKPPAVPRLIEVMKKEEIYTTLPNEVHQVKAFVEKHASS
jgi:threonine synthase